MHRFTTRATISAAIALVSVLAWAQVDPVCSSPGVAIPDTDPVGVSDSIVLGPGATITDLNVSIQVTHTWVGDLIVTLERTTGPGAPVGPFTIIDRPGVPPGAGCSGDDIDAILDDSAATSVEDECGGGVPTINGTFMPSPDALSNFNGFSEGTWVLTISDNAGGDLGTLDQWCLDGTPNVPVELLQFSIE